MAAQSKAWVYGRSLAGIEGSNPAGVVDVFLVSVRRIHWIRSSFVVPGITNGFHLLYFLYLIGCDVHFFIYLFIYAVDVYLFIPVKDLSQ